MLLENKKKPSIFCKIVNTMQAVLIKLILLNQRWEYFISMVVLMALLPGVCWLV